MICVKIQAGFGNQLFQYAMGYSLSKKMGQPLLLDISFNRYHQLRRNLGLKTPEMFRNCYLEYLKIDKYQFIGTPVNHWMQCIGRKLGAQSIRIKGQKLPMRIEDFDRCREFQTELLEDISIDGVYLEGFWQNYAYFDDVQTELRQIFNPNYTFNANVTAVMNEIQTSNSVGIHIRRGDFM